MGRISIVARAHRMQYAWTECKNRKREKADQMKNKRIIQFKSVLAISPKTDENEPAKTKEVKTNRRDATKRNDDGWKERY